MIIEDNFKWFSFKEFSSEVIVHEMNKDLHTISCFVFNTIGHTTQLGIQVLKKETGQNGITDAKP